MYVRRGISRFSEGAISVLRSSRIGNDLKGVDLANRPLFRFHPFSTRGMASATTTASGDGMPATAGAEEILDRAAVPEAETVEEPLPERTKLVVLGGNGFVGRAVCKEAINRGIPVVSLNRSGAPAVSENWVSQVDWVRGSLFELSKWRALFRDATAVISCVGGFGSEQAMRRINGEANALAAEVASQEGVERFVYISAHDVGLPGFVLKGYYDGKREAEKAVSEYFPYSGVILRPGMIHGTRQVGPVQLPLSVIGAPLELVLKNAKWASTLPVVGPALVPPVKVSAVARTAVRGAVDHAIPPGVVDVWGILRFGDK
eukprot:TRINITY_DN35891_c0_g1_i1.p1 TRINITY_DN35891_c0_g1~~TRINITY_DN35891_c0_g1_i1.p1  ORF type:complete len:317 (-),score=47.75 TRINITY_DN35891_c0_g1_i1:1166-2116(-)